MEAKSREQLGKSQDGSRRVGKTDWKLWNKATGWVLEAVRHRVRALRQKP